MRSNLIGLSRSGEKEWQIFAQIDQSDLICEKERNPGLLLSKRNLRWAQVWVFYRFSVVK